MSEEVVSQVKPELTADQKVANGVKFIEVQVILGKIPANWRELIDVDNLRMISGEWCVLGQIGMHVSSGGQGFTWAMDELGGSVESGDFGFTVPWTYNPVFNDRGEKWDALTEAWKRELTKA